MGTIVKIRVCFSVRDKHNLNRIYSNLFGLSFKDCGSVIVFQKIRIDLSPLDVKFRKHSSIFLIDQYIYFELLAKQSFNLNPATTITVPLQYIIIFASALSFIFIIILICCIAILLKHQRKRKLKRFAFSILANKLGLRSSYFFLN